MKDDLVTFSYLTLTLVNETKAAILETNEPIVLPFQCDDVSLKFLPRIVFVAREIRHLAKLNGHNFSEIKKVALAWLRDARSGLFVRKEITPEPVKESKQMFWNLYLEDLKRLYPLMYITEVLNRSINPSLN